MRISTMSPCLLASATLLAGCDAVRGAAADVASVAYAFDPAKT